MFIRLNSFPKSCKLSSASSLVNQIIGIKSSLRTEEVHLAAKKVIRLTVNLIKNGKLAENRATPKYIWISAVLFYRRSLSPNVNIMAFPNRKHVMPTFIAPQSPLLLFLLQCCLTRSVVFSTQTQPSNMIPYN